MTKLREEILIFYPFILAYLHAKLQLRIQEYTVFLGTVSLEDNGNAVRIKAMNG